LQKRRDDVGFMGDLESDTDFEPSSDESEDSDPEYRFRKQPRLSSSHQTPLSRRGKAYLTLSSVLGSTVLMKGTWTGEPTNIPTIQSLFGDRAYLINLTDEKDFELPQQDGQLPRSFHFKVSKEGKRLQYGRRKFILEAGTAFHFE
jgi:hypothetical protein